jgi:ribonuclease HII
VVVAAVVLDPARRINGIADSKRLLPERRELLYGRIVERAVTYRVVVVDVEEIDRINIFRATMLGMAQALRGLACTIDEAWIDGNHLPAELPCPARAIVDGDARERCIGAASILAKVTRDRLMCELDVRYPGYGFASHKGYSTPEHLAALRRLGPCPLHRRSFAPVRRWFEPDLFDSPDSAWPTSDD